MLCTNFNNHGTDKYFIIYNLIQRTPAMHKSGNEMGHHILGNGLVRVRHQDIKWTITDMNFVWAHKNKIQRKFNQNAKYVFQMLPTR